MRDRVCRDRMAQGNEVPETSCIHDISHGSAPCCVRSRQSMIVVRGCLWILFRQHQLEEQWVGSNLENAPGAFLAGVYDRQTLVLRRELNDPRWIHQHRSH